MTVRKNNILIYESFPKSQIKENANRTLSPVCVQARTGRHKGFISNILTFASLCLCGKKKTFRKGLIYFLIIIFLTSCAGIKVTRRHRIKKLNVEKIYSRVKANEVSYNTFSIKFAAKLNLDEKNNSISGVLRIKKDSAIWMSISPGFGVEIVRVLLTPDSVKMINRLNSTYFAGDYHYLNNLLNFNFDYNTVQSIFTNTFFSYHSNNINQGLNNFTSKIDTDGYFLQSLPIDLQNDTNVIMPGVIQQILINPDAYKIYKILLIDYLRKRNFEIRFSDYIDVQNNKLPQNLSFTFTNRNKKSEINIKYNKITVDKNVRMPFKISKKYKQIK